MPVTFIFIVAGTEMTIDIVVYRKDRHCLASDFNTYGGYIESMWGKGKKPYNVSCAALRDADGFKLSLMRLTSTLENIHDKDFWVVFHDDSLTVDEEIGVCAKHAAQWSVELSGAIRQAYRSEIGVAFAVKGFDRKKIDQMYELLRHKTLHG